MIKPRHLPRRRLPCSYGSQGLVTVAAESHAMKPSSAHGIKAADAFLRRWLPPLLFVVVVALSVTLLYRATAPAVLVSSASGRVELIDGPPVVVKQQLPSSHPMPGLQYEPASSAPAVVALDPPPVPQNATVSVASVSPHQKKKKEK